MDLASSERVSSAGGIGILDSGNLCSGSAGQLMPFSLDGVRAYRELFSIELFPSTVWSDLDNGISHVSDVIVAHPLLGEGLRRSL